MSVPKSLIAVVIPIAGLLRHGGLVVQLGTAAIPHGGGATCQNEGKAHPQGKIPFRR